MKSSTVLKGQNVEKIVPDTHIGGDEVGDESGEEHFSCESASFSSDASTCSVPLPKRNKRKAYVPRGACSVLMPAGVDLFEPEYDPVPSGGTTNALCNVRTPPRLTKISDQPLLQARSVAPLPGPRNRQSSVKVSETNEEAVNGGTAPLTGNDKDASENDTDDARDSRLASPVRFKSDKIRKAFSKYKIRKANTDSLHMTFILQSNKQAAKANA
ncbi:unnamed protein product [Gongylonema pulchrum]|uniref:Shugoshin_C domain-containing protein n=1 Tax=Gongylonema pulchrum TaxID=637853 RepID=A0A183DP56_9BILA|nr:unnamed protein product [Gongylonema pulchrum]